MAPARNVVADVEPHRVLRDEASTVAFTTLYRDHRPRVYAMLRRLLRDPHDAEDATQQVFVKLLESLPRLEDRGDGLEAWLNRVSVNHAQDRLRRRRFDPTTPEAILARLDGAAGSSGRRWSDGTASELLELLDGLSQLQRQVVFLRIVAEMTSGEAADLLGTTAGTVRQALYLALKALGPALGSTRRAPVRREEPIPFRGFAPGRDLLVARFGLRPRWAGALGR